MEVENAEAGRGSKFESPEERWDGSQLAATASTVLSFRVGDASNGYPASSWTVWFELSRESAVGRVREVAAVERAQALELEGWASAGFS